MGHSTEIIPWKWKTDGIECHKYLSGVRLKACTTKSSGISYLYIDERHTKFLQASLYDDAKISDEGMQVDGWIRFCREG